MQSKINIIVSILPSSPSQRMKVRFLFLVYVFYQIIASPDAFRVISMEKFGSVKYLLYMTIFGLKQGKSCFRVRDNELLYTVSSACLLLKALFPPVSWCVASTFQFCYFIFFEEAVMQPDTTTTNFQFYSFKLFVS